MSEGREVKSLGIGKEELEVDGMAHYKLLWSYL